MGGGTKKCTICNTSNAAASLFLCEGIFCRRTTVDWKMIDHYSTAGPNMLIRQKWIMNERGCGEERFVKGELFVCMQCAKGAIEYCENVIGYLTLAEHSRYRRDATMCNKLFVDGYAVIPRDQWKIASFPLHEFFNIVNENIKCMAKLPNTEGGGVSELRKWLPFKKPTQCLKTYYNEVQIRSERLLSPDKAYGRIAWNNRAKLCNAEAIDNSPTVIVSESAALWRGSGLDIYQRSHADGESGQFNIVEPLTNGYLVRVWPRSHFLVKSRLSSTDTCLAGGEEDVILKVGERLVFHSNLVHCGGPARFQTGMDLPVDAIAAFLHNELPRGFTWFSQKRRLPNAKLTDLSIHYVLDSTGVGTLTHASHSSGYSEVITIKVLDKTEDDPQVWNEWAEKNKADISKGEREFVDKTCRPEKINTEGPCVHFVKETLEVLKSYQIGALPGYRPFHGGCRFSKRLKTNRGMT
jgi:hypothetical protein